MFQSVHFQSHTLIKMCTCISTCIHVHQTYHVCFTPLNSYMEALVPLCGTVVVSQPPHFSPHALFRMCTCISTCTHDHQTSHVCSTPCAVTCRHGCHCVALCVCSNQPTFSCTSSLACVHVYMSMWVPIVSSMFLA